MGSSYQILYSEIMEKFNEKLADFLIRFIDWTESKPVSMWTMRVMWGWVVVFILYVVIKLLS